MTKLFQAEFGISKRFPKKSNDTHSHKPISVTKVPLDKFPDLLSDKPIAEIVETQSREDVF
jgi:hypothetical protein